MKVKELIKMLEGYEDFDIELTVHRRLSDEVLKRLTYPFPYENIDTELELDDIGYSNNVVCLGCKI